MMYDLPFSVEVCGTQYGIRSDYRAALDICAALSDPGLSDTDKALCALHIFYPGFDRMPQEHYRQALERCFWFLNGGEEEQGGPAPRLVDWQQDFRLIAAPINRVLGREIRASEPLHWWSFLAAYYEIGDCTFAQVVRIRDRLARGRPLDRQDREWYRQNRRLVDMKRRYTAAEDTLLDVWTGKRKTAP